MRALKQKMIFILGNPQALVVVVIIIIIFVYFYSGKKYTGAPGELAPESHKRAPKICIEFNAKQIKDCYFHAS